MPRNQTYNSSAAHGEAFAAPGIRHQAITPSASTTYEGVRALRIGGAGDVAVVDAAGTSITYTCAAGEVLQIGAVQVLAAGTTATGIVAWF